MNFPWGHCMQITVELPSQLLREAELRGKPVADFVQQLLELGITALNAQTRQEPDLPDSSDPSVVQSAMERIRALNNTALNNTASNNTGLHKAASLSPAHRG